MTCLKGKVVLITGADGFIGRHLVDYLAKYPDIQLILLSREKKENNKNNIFYVTGNLMQLSKEFWVSLGIQSIDYVFHLGSFTPKRASDGNLIDVIIENNILGTRNLLNSFSIKLKKFVFASSVDVYAPPQNNERLNENFLTEPKSIHGASKLFCESLVRSWSKTNGCNYSILRYGHIYGPGEEKYKKLIPEVIRALFSGKPPTIYGDGSLKRDYLNVRDVVEATIRACCTEGDLGPVNIVSGESIAIETIVQLLIKIVGLNIQPKVLESNVPGISLNFDNQLMLKMLGKWSLEKLENGLKAEVESFERNSK